MKISPKCQTWDKWLFVVRLFDNKISMDKNISPERESFSDFICTFAMSSRVLSVLLQH